MARGTQGPLDPDQLVGEYRLYDRAVDIVSIYHWLFTGTKELPATVEHFERYPRVPTDAGSVVTPDFTFLFKDGRGIAAEIANIALHDGSVESLCRQLDKYSRLTHLPDAQGGLSPVRVLDVVYLTPIETASAAVRRVCAERLDSPDHWYKPARRPVVIQFAASPDFYVLQFWPDKSVNGSLEPGGDANYCNFEDMKVKPGHFAANKVKFGFMNDPVKPLYLATRLWTSIFPSRFGTDGVFEASGTEITRVVQDQYGIVRSTDVDAAMAILRVAGLATEKDGVWRVRRRNLRPIASDIHAAIAKMIDQGPPTSKKRKRSSHDSPPLFEFDEMAGEATA